MKAKPPSEDQHPGVRELPDGSVFYQGDCTQIARSIPSDSLDLIVTDPPYGINGDKLDQHYNRKENFVVDGYVEVPMEQYGEFSHEWIKEAARTLRPGGSLYVISGYSNLYHILHALRATDLKEINHIIWKYNFGVFTKRKFVSSHYHILYYTKPGDTHTFNLECRYGTDERTEKGGSMNYLDREDVWTINREYKPGQKKNKNELPTQLLAKLIQYSSNPSDTVADFFLGGGSTARVAMGLDRRAVGIELSQAMFEHTTERLSKVQVGDLKSQMRVPKTTDQKNQGKRWTPTERESFQKRYHQLRRQGTKKTQCIEILKEEFGRGRFAVLNAIDAAEETVAVDIHDQGAR